MGRMSLDGETLESKAEVPETSDSLFRGLQLVIAWSVAEPARVGEVGRFGGSGILGRGDDGSKDRVRWYRERPSGVEPRPPLADPRVSREQLEIRRLDDTWLEVRAIGRRAVVIDGRPLETGETRCVSVGSRLTIGDRLLLAVAPTEPFPPAEGRLHPFGEPDDDGLVGESPACWHLRALLRTYGPRRRHALVYGETGVGKELVARALHRHSARSAGPFVARNSATFPEGLIDAELFGNVRNYPNPGMPDRPGLVGEAHGGSVFLDEIGELPHALQAHLLRVLDSGEYQRLGEARSRVSDVRLIAATNRNPHDLKHDLVARFVIRIPIPPLRERIRDVPLLLRFLGRQLATEDPHLAPQLLDENREPRIACDLVDSLLSRPLDGNVRELEQAIWDALGATPPGSPLRLPEADGVGAPDTPDQVTRRHQSDISREEVVAALDACGWKREQTWRSLGLKDRYQLRRLMRRYEITDPASER